MSSEKSLSEGRLGGREEIEKKHVTEVTMKRKLGERAQFYFFKSYWDYEMGGQFCGWNGD